MIFLKIGLYNIPTLYRSSPSRQPRRDYDFLKAPAFSEQTAYKVYGPEEG